MWDNIKHTKECVMNFPRRKRKKNTKKTRKNSWLNIFQI